jgi:hypothetical protein
MVHSWVVSNGAEDRGRKPSREWSNDDIVVVTTVE